MTTTTTTNYGWTIPQDSELVKDGAAAIRTLGNAADASLKTVSDAALKATIVDAKGDLIVGSAADTAARLAVGANDYVLTADSTQSTGVKWAAVASGGMTLLSTTTLSGASTTVSSISQSYTDLQIIVNWTSATQTFPLIQCNGSTTVNYTASYNDGVQCMTYDDGRYYPRGYNASGTYGRVATTIYDYTNSSNFKQGYGASSTGTSNGYGGALVNHLYGSNSAVSSITVAIGSGTFSGGTVKIYGVK